MATKVTSLEFQKQFGRYGELALRQPVTITKHGRDSLVVMSAEEYERLRALDSRRAYHPSELPDDLAEALLKAEPPEWTHRYDSEL